MLQIRIKRHISLFAVVASLFATSVSAVITPTDVLTDVALANGDRYGWSVDIDGDTAIVGVPNADGTNFPNTGVAYVYVNDGLGTWTLEATLEGFSSYRDDQYIVDADFASDVLLGQTGAAFGYSVAIHGDIAVIGEPLHDVDTYNPDGVDELTLTAPLPDDVPDITDSGAVYIFERTAGVWNGGIRWTEELDGQGEGNQLGHAVGVHGRTVIASKVSDLPSGSVSIYFQDYDGIWREQYAQKANAEAGTDEQISLAPFDTDAEDRFGQSIAIHGNTIVVGSDSSDGTGTGSGSAYVYTRDVHQNWNLQSKIVPDDPAALAGFGVSVDIDGNTIIVGSDGADVATTSEGAAYVFDRDFEGAWTQTSKLSASDATSGDKFGYSVSLSKPLAVVGAWSEDTNGTQSGSVYLFGRDSGGTWAEVDFIRGAAAFDNMGFAVGVTSIDNEDDYWVISGTPQLLANNIGAVEITDNIASLIDTDGDLITNDVDTDHDGDLISNANDLFPYDALAFSDVDGDGFSDSVDLFPNNPTESADTDNDGHGNNIDIDDDGDTLSDSEEIENGTNPLDPDTDGDGVDDLADLFPLDLNESADYDLDGVGDNADTDDDNDGELDVSDAFPFDANESVDTDGDGVGNTADTDDDGDTLSDAAELAAGTDPLLVDTDGDGVNDNNDPLPLDATETLDTDNDGIGNNADTDDDNDGVQDAVDAFPLDYSESVDTDSDGQGNNADIDDDNDSVVDSSDAFPLDPTETLDTDGDGVGNNTDTDDDNDGVLDVSDAFPLDSTETTDADGNGVGDNADAEAAGTTTTTTTSGGGGGSLSATMLLGMMMAGLLRRRRV